MSRINQYECNACTRREDAKDAEAGQQWVEVKLEAVHKSSESFKVSVVHICPECVPKLDVLGIPTARFATSIREDNAARLT